MENTRLKIDSKTESIAFRVRLLAYGLFTRGFSVVFSEYVLRCCVKSPQSYHIVCYRGVVRRELLCSHPDIQIIRSFIYYASQGGFCPIKNGINVYRPARAALGSYPGA